MSVCFVEDARSDAIPVVAAGVPIVGPRAEDGEIRAFHNVCRHRATIVLQEPAKRLRHLQCPSHAWTYGLDGSLRATPYFDGTPDSPAPGSTARDTVWFRCAAASTAASAARRFVHAAPAGGREFAPSSPTIAVPPTWEANVPALGVTTSGSRPRIPSAAGPTRRGGGRDDLGRRLRTGPACWPPSLAGHPEKFRRQVGGGGRTRGRRRSPSPAQLPVHAPRAITAWHGPTAPGVRQPTKHRYPTLDNLGTCTAAVIIPQFQLLRRLRRRRGFGIVADLLAGHVSRRDAMAAMPKPVDRRSLSSPGPGATL